MTDPTSIQFGDAGEGLFSEQQVLHLLKVEFRRSRRYSYPLSCLVVRVDRLERIGDVHGFEAQDLVMSEVVRSVTAQIRTCDFLGLLPDQRLLVVMPHTPEDGIRIVADRLVERIGGNRFEFDGKQARITCSIGVAAFDADQAEFYDQILEAARKAADVAAASGGGRVEMAVPGA